MSSKKQASSIQIYLRLLGYIRPYRLAFVVSMICMGLSAVVEPVLPMMMKELLDEGFSKAHDSLDWLIYPAAIIILFMLRALFSFAGSYVLAWVANHVIMEIRRQMFNRILAMPIYYFHKHLSGRIISRVAHDVNGLAEAVTRALTSCVKDSLAVLGLVGWMLYLNWKLTLVILAVFPLIAYLMRVFGVRLRRVSHGIQEAQGEVTQILQESIEGNKEIRIFGGQQYEAQRFGRALQNQRHMAMRTTVAAALQGPLVQFFASIALAVVIGIALKQAADQQTTVGGFVSFVTAMGMMLAPLKRLADVNTHVQRGLAAAESVFSLLDYPLGVDQGTVVLGDQKASSSHKTDHVTGTVRGEITFDKVSFCYPESQANALSDISFNIQPGECVALVGQSGSGKTTVANLLPRFYEANGQILVDGYPIKTISLDSLRNNISLVSQDVILFNGSVSENIAYGTCHDASAEKIRAAAQAASALEFIESMPEGFNTLIGEHGVKLSGGQRQRMAIARAILKDAPILILDEATSALDNESERQVQAALDQLMQGRTTLVIAHRLSTIKRADRILVLSAGKIVESGAHEDLLARGGNYARLYELHQEIENGQQ